MALAILLHCLKLYSQCAGSLTAGSSQLISNGDFSAGNSGFNTTLLNNCTCGSNFYCVTTNSNNKCDIYGVTGYGGSGNFLMIDSPWSGNRVASGNDVYWSQTIILAPNTEYNFSFFHRGFSISFLGLPPAVISVFINGIQQGANITTGSIGAAWTKYNLNFNSGSMSGPIVFELRPASTPGTNSGWELGLDNFNLTTCDNTLPLELHSLFISENNVHLIASDVEPTTKCTFYIRDADGNVYTLHEQYCQTFGTWKTSVNLPTSKGEVWACLENLNETTCSSVAWFDLEKKILKIEVFQLDGKKIGELQNENALRNFISTLPQGTYLQLNTYNTHTENSLIRSW
jgi:hypothetical protein